MSIALVLVASSELALPKVAGAHPFVINYSHPPATLDPARVCDLRDNGFISSLYVTVLQYEDVPIDGAPAGIVATQEGHDPVQGLSGGVVGDLFGRHNPDLQDP